MLHYFLFAFLSFPPLIALLYKLTQVIGTCSRKQTHECPLPWVPPHTQCVSLGGRDKMFGKSKRLLSCDDQNWIQKLKTHSDCKVFLAVFLQGAPRHFTAVLLLYTPHAPLALCTIVWGTKKCCLKTQFRCKATGKYGWQQFYFTAVCSCRRIIL